jgi:hypothetical protein
MNRGDFMPLSIYIETKHWGFVTVFAPADDKALLSCASPPTPVCILEVDQPAHG